VCPSPHSTAPRIVLIVSAFRRYAAAGPQEERFWPWVWARPDFGNMYKRIRNELNDLRLRPGPCLAGVQHLDDGHMSTICAVRCLVWRSDLVSHTYRGEAVESLRDTGDHVTASGGSTDLD
jgi:hypothetical protein